jgi:hypothetical protein
MVKLFPDGEETSESAEFWEAWRNLDSSAERLIGQTGAKKSTATADNKRHQENFTIAPPRPGSGAGAHGVSPEQGVYSYAGI